MKIESIRLKNFKAFKDVEMSDIPKLCVLVGANGTGKSSFFSVFGFLKDALNGNVNTALAKLGGARGFDEVVSRNSSGPIEIELIFRKEPDKDSPLITYFLRIGKTNNGYAPGQAGRRGFGRDFSLKGGGLAGAEGVIGAKKGLGGAFLGL